MELFQFLNHKHSKKVFLLARKVAFKILASQRIREELAVSKDKMIPEDKRIRALKEIAFPYALAVYRYC